MAALPVIDPRRGAVSARTRASSRLISRCADGILLQIAAVKAALTWEPGMRACVNSCMLDDLDARHARVTKALATVLKSS